MGGRKYFGQLFTQKWKERKKKQTKNTGFQYLELTTFGSTGSKIISCFTHKKKHFSKRYFNQLYKLSRKSQAHAFFFILIGIENRIKAIEL